MGILISRKKSMSYLRMKFFLFSFLILKTINVYSQDTAASVVKTFEGKVTYVYQILNPNSALISDEDFYRDMPNGGKSSVTLFIKGNQYRWEYEDRIEIYLPKTQQIAIYSKRNQDSVYYAYAHIAEEPMEKIEKSPLTKRILNHDLSAYTVSTKWDTKTFFYNPHVLKTNSNYWKNHLRDYLGNFISKSSCFPLMILQKSLLGNWAMAAVKIEPEKIADDVFILKK